MKAWRVATRARQHEAEVHNRTVSNWFLRKGLWRLSLLVGSFLGLYGIYTAVVDQSTYWYTFFIIGSFLLFDSLDKQCNGDSNLFRLFKGQPQVVVGTYLLFFLMGVLIDVVLGRGIGDMWVYPRLAGFSKFFHVLVIGYPFSLLSVSTMYRTVDGLITRALHEEAPDHGNALDSVWKRHLAKLLAVMFFVLLTVPILNWLIFDNRHAQEILVICCILGIFSISPIGYLVFDESWFGTLIRPERHTPIALMLTSAVAGLLHELPNTFASAWVYKNIPFTSYEVLEINIIILVPGWIFLTILAVSGNDFFFQWAKSKQPQPFSGSARRPDSNAPLNQG